MTSSLASGYRLSMNRMELDYGWWVVVAGLLLHLYSASVAAANHPD